MMPQGGKPGEPNSDKVTGMRRAEEGNYEWQHMAPSADWLVRLYVDTGGLVPLVSELQHLLGKGFD